MSLISHARYRLSLVAAATLGATFACRTPGAGTASGPAQPSVNELLSADRRYAEASLRTNVIDGLSAMFADDVALFSPGQSVTTTAAEAIAILSRDTTSRSTRMDWVPVRAGISADGTQGFTAGYATLRRADGSTASQKYLSYWIKGPAGWKVAVYKRGRRPVGAGPMAELAPVLPQAHAGSVGDSRMIEQFRQSLAAAERAFSDDAQAVGLEKAFARHGSADAMNMGGATGADFVIGAAQIGKVVGVDEPATGSSVKWAPDRVIVAPSGDLGITIGTIRGTEAGSTLAVPFCTVWHRGSPNEPWRYVAE